MEEVDVDFGGAAVVLVFEEDFLLGLAEDDLESDDRGEEEEVVVFVCDKDTADSFLDDVNAASDEEDANDDKDVSDDAFSAVISCDTG